MIDHASFYNRYGVRKYEQLGQPLLASLSVLSLPYSSALHYLPENSTEVGPDVTNMLFNGLSGQRYIEHVMEYNEPIGSPIWNKLSPSTILSGYKRTHRELKTFSKLADATRDRTTMLIVNYAMLDRLWRYPDTYLAIYNRWKNLRSVLWRKVIGVYNAAPTRNQFIVLDMPTGPLPDYQAFDLASNSINRNTTRIFDNPAILDMLDLYMWASPNREHSTLSILSAEVMSKVNIIFRSGGFWSVLNLGAFNQWISGEGLGTEKQIEVGKDPAAMRKTFLAYLNQIKASDSTAGSTKEVVVGSTGDEIITANVVDEDLAEPVTPAATQIDVKVSPKNALLDMFGLTQPEQPDVTPPPVTAPAAKPGKRDLGTIKVGIDADESILRAFWDIDQPKIDLDEILQPIHNAKTEKVKDVLSAYDMGVLNMASRYAEEGRITAAEFRRFERLASKYREIQVGGETLASLAAIDPAIIHSVKEVEIPKIPGVLDNSMRQTTLKDFDQKYIKQVMQADVANMVLNMQRGGYAVTAYTQDRVQSVANDYTQYTIALTPVDGERSTIKFKIPTVHPDGSYIINGTKVFMKKQRIDVPIRKVAYNTVALTSYYGKVFVNRDEKKVNDYGAWLVRKIRLGARDMAGKYSDLHYGVGIAETIKVPRIYSTLSRDFLNFKYGEYSFDFRYNKREELFDAKLLTNPETRMPCGWVKDGNKKIPIVVESDGLIYRSDDDGLIGTIEDILEIDASKAPMDITMVKIYGKLVPVALALGINYGMDTLLKLLHVTPRVVSAGERVKAAHNEYVIRFADKTLVLPRGNTVSTMILGGFNVYSKELIRYDYQDFNGQDVYVNLLESQGLGARYSREIRSLYDFFVDPITREILKDMKEPTEFGTLLVRATQLMLTDYCPEETDLDYMRIAGYERMAGAVYRNMVMSIRAQRIRPSGLRGPVEMHPEAVWRSIMSDGSAQLKEEANAIHNLKEMEAVTFAGTGGRGFRSMVRATRVYHENDLGTISEATVDSSAVAINTSTSANPKFVSLRGMTGRFDPEFDGPARLQSTSALISPASDRDDQHFCICL